MTAPILHAFVDRVVGHEADKSGGKRERQVDIQLNFIGRFGPPTEVALDTESEEKRAMWREYKRKQREKTKQDKTT